MKCALKKSYRINFGKYEKFSKDIHYKLTVIQKTYEFVRYYPNNIVNRSRPTSINSSSQK